MKRSISTDMKHLLLITLSFSAVFPLSWMIISSFKGEAEIYN